MSEFIENQSHWHKVKPSDPPLEGALMEVHGNYLQLHVQEADDEGNTKEGYVWVKVRPITPSRVTKINSVLTYSEKNEKGDEWFRVCGPGGFVMGQADNLRGALDDAIEEVNRLIEKQQQ